MYRRAQAAQATRPRRRDARAPQSRRAAAVVAAARWAAWGLVSRAAGAARVVHRRLLLSAKLVDCDVLKRRLFGNKTERLQTSENQVALGGLLNEEKQLQKQLNAALAQTKSSAEGDLPPAPPAEEAKPKGRRDLSTSDLPKVLLEMLDEDLEKSAKRVGWDVSHQLLFRRGGFSVLVKRVAKYEVPGKDGPTVLGVFSVRSRSLETCAMVRSPTLQRRTASALNSGVNTRRFRRCCFLTMAHSLRILAPIGVSTKAGDFHFGRDAGN